MPSKKPASKGGGKKPAAKSATKPAVKAKSTKKAPAKAAPAKKPERPAAKAKGAKAAVKPTSNGADTKPVAAVAAKPVIAAAAVIAAAPGVAGAVPIKPPAPKKKGPPKPIVPWAQRFKDDAPGPWTCPKCGALPQRAQPLYGEDERHHCPNLDCDQVVTLLSKEDLEPAEKRGSWPPQRNKNRQIPGQGPPGHLGGPPAPMAEPPPPDAE